MPPITLVQSRIASGTSLAFASPVTKGNLIVVVAASLDTAGGVTFACADTQTNSYTGLSLVDANPISGGRVQAFFAAAKTSGADTPSITTASISPQIAIHEFSGLDGFTTSGSATGTGNAQDSGAVAVGSINNLLFGYSLCFPLPLSLTQGTGWTKAQSLLTGGLITEYQIAGAVGSYDATTTTTNGKSGVPNWATGLAAWGAVAEVRYFVGCRQRISRVWPGMNNYR